MSARLSYTEERIRSATSTDVVLGSLLERHAAQRPGEVFATFEDGTAWTRAQCLDAARSAADVLRRSGVRPGDRVGLLMGNGPGFLRAWWGTALLGAVTFPMNTAFRGEPLARALRLARPRVVVAEPSLVERLPDSAVPHLDPGELLGGDPVAPGGRTELWDDQFLLLTSGTTGPSKLVRVSHLYPYVAYSSILAGQQFGPDDVFLVDLPLFHMAALGYLYSCLVTGSRVHVRSRPALDRYWEVLGAHDITGCVLISSMVPMLMSQPARPAEREHRMRFMLAAPVPGDVEGFKRRFRIPTLLTSWGSTEMSAAVIGEAVPGVASGFCGTVRPGYEVRVVDEHDQDVPTGAVGEGVVRASRPFVMSSGYFADDAATGRAWRHGWFHSGDLLRADEHGSLHFVERAGDAIRRRGENVSAFEVEQAVLGFPGVAEAAAVAVPSDTGVDHEIKVWVVPGGGAGPDWAKLLEHCLEELPHFMVPRYFQAAPELPKSPTAKIQKYLLRERGNSADTWDSVAHGLVVTRRGLERTR